LPHPHSLGQVQHSTPTTAVSVRLQFAVYAFQFCWVQSAQELHKTIFPGREIGTAVMHGA
jgi:hypothetical protein